jgi:uncharacterized protein YjbI with pentapeptide repeats
VASIFLSYRRADTEAHAGRLFDSLKHHLPDAQVFMDVDSLRGGENFPDALRRTISSADVMLVLIGNRWLTERDEEGRRRLDLPDDFVHLEIAGGLARGLHLIPVLVQGTAMPSPKELPEALQEIGRRHAVELRHARWNDDVAKLVERIEDLLVSRRSVPVAKALRVIRRHRWLPGLLRGGAVVSLVTIAVLLGYATYRYATTSDERAIISAADQVRYENPEEQTLGALIAIRTTVVRANDPELTNLAVTRLKSVVLTSDDKTDKGRRIRKAAMETIKTLRNGNLTLDFSGNDLQAADLVDVDLRRTNLRGVSLEDAFLLRTDFSGSDLTGSNLSGAYVRNADFSGVTLTGADVTALDWFNADGFSLSQLKTVVLTTLAGCPKDATRASSSEAFLARLDEEYGFDWEDIYGPDKTELTRVWARYAAPDGLCDQIAMLVGK